VRTKAYIACATLLRRSLNLSCSVVRLIETSRQFGQAETNDMQLNPNLTCAISRGSRQLGHLSSRFHESSMNAPKRRPINRRSNSTLCRWPLKAVVAPPALALQPITTFAGLARCLPTEAPLTLARAIRPGANPPFESIPSDRLARPRADKCDGKHGTRMFGCQSPTDLG
jgi:hypothetical protein